VGLTNLTYPVWAAHVTQYIDNAIEEREQEKNELVSLQAQVTKTQLKDMRDKVKQNKAQVKQMSPHAPPPAMQSQPPPVSYEPYPHQPAASQSRPPFRNKGKGRSFTKLKYGPRKNYMCYQCRRYGHWANQCRAKQYSQQKFEYNTYPPPKQDPPQAPPHSDPHQNSGHQAPGTHQMPHYCGD